MKNILLYLNGKSTTCTIDIPSENIYQKYKHKKKEEQLVKFEQKKLLKTNLMLK